MAKIAPIQQSAADGMIQRYQFPVVGYRRQKTLPQTPVSSFSRLRATVRRVRERDRRLQQVAQQAVFAEAQQRGYQEGYAEGLRVGQQEAQQQHQQSAEQWLGLINSIWHELSNLHQATLLNLGQPLLELITKVVEQVVNHELATSPQSLQQLVSNALDLLPETQSVVLAINPQDRALLEPVLARLPTQWLVREDDTITQGGCRLISEHGEVDATVEGRLASCLDLVHEQLVSHD